MILSRFWILILAIGAFLAPLTLFGQQNGDYKIVIKTNQSSEKNFVVFGKFLLQHEFQIRARDPNFHVLGTKWKDYTFKPKNIIYHRKYAIDAKMNDQDMIITIQCKPGGGRGNVLVYDSNKVVHVEIFQIVVKLLEGYGGDMSFHQ